MGQRAARSGACERGCVQEGKVQGVTGCSPSGFRQVKVAVCGPYLLGCEMGPCNMAVLKPHPAAHHPAFALRCGREAPLSVLVAVCSSLGRSGCCVCVASPQCPASPSSRADGPRAMVRVSSYNYSPCLGWL